MRSGKETCEAAGGVGNAQSLGQPSLRCGTRLVGVADPTGSKAVAAPVLHASRAARWGNRKLTLAAFVAAVVALAAIVVAGLLVTDAATATDFAQKNLAPSLAHPFGTDWMGRDMLLRTLAGLSTSVLVGLLAAGTSSVIALVLGAVAALGGKKADAAVTWLIDLMMGVPHIVLLILISFALGKGFWGVAIGVAVTHWPSLARVVRAEILQCRESTFVAVARKLGQSPVRIALKHMVPYVLPQFIVGLILLFPHAILHEAAVTFLGFGLPPEQPAIGVILSESMAYLSAGMWWLAVFPGLALIATVLLFDVAGSNLRKLIDPHSSQE
ncbi:ABC transporter permease [Gordonibacter urolithinfaciens]|uniref:ABC transporter permease n=1 Tax=Gordonibacter urolithinfaciens TaxID=1335613 RepID=UPI000F4BB275|nr:ABC transporter permease [Gordonibacter urolithinfaciens]ROT92410.1 ABC transporter permease [Gordonibacter urolithinfaciens]